MKRIGIVGCGGIAGVHAEAVRQIEGAELVAVCDKNREKAEAFSERYANSKTPAVYDSLENMLCEAELDILHICTPHDLHVSMAIRALEQGIHVFVEKPPAITGEEFERLRKAVEHTAGKTTEHTAGKTTEHTAGKTTEQTAGKTTEQTMGKTTEQTTARLGFCFQNRYNRSTAELDRLVRERVLGEVTGARAFVTWRRDADYYACSDWKGRIATEGGGALINQAIHTLDLLLRYLGKPERVEASLQNHHTADRIEAEDTVEAWMEFAGGKRACFYASTAYGTDAPILLELECEKGRITLLNGSVLICRNGETTVVPCAETAGAGKDYWGAGHLSCIRDFYEKTESGMRFQNDLEGVEDTILTVLRIYEKGRAK